MNWEYGLMHWCTRTKRFAFDLIQVSPIQGISIEKGDQGQLNIEINASLGNCWGKEELAKGFAREALKALFASDLPVSHVVLHVYGSADILLTVALGENQAENLNWDKEESLNFFFKLIRSKMNYGGNPADYCWLIENNSGFCPWHLTSYKIAPHFKLSRRRQEKYLFSAASAVNYYQKCSWHRHAYRGIPLSIANYIDNKSCFGSLINCLSNQLKSLMFLNCWSI